MPSEQFLVDADLLQELRDVASRLVQVIDRVQSRASERAARRRAAEEPSDCVTDWQVLESKRLPRIENIEQIRLEARWWSAEDLCYPETPEACVQLALSRISESDHPVERARQAFVAGFCDRLHLETRTNNTAERAIPTLSLHWVIFRGPHLRDPCRVLSRGEASHLTDQFEESSIWQVFSTEAEVEIYCTGANLLLPTLIQWRSQ